MGFPRRAALLACALSVLACGETTPTQILVRIDADPEMRSRATRLLVRALDAAGAPRYERSARIASPDPEVALPATVPLVPVGGDASRRFEVVAQLLSDAGDVIATQRAITGFVEGELREIWIRFESDCAAVDCGDGETCASGGCTDACVLPTALGETDRPERVACPEPACEPGCGPCERCEEGACVAADDGSACGGGRCRAGACCTGCWDAASSACVAGDTLEACGAGGVVCETCCAGDVACDAGACRPPAAIGQVAAGEAHACAADAEGRLWCWGANDSGQLGDGTTTDAATPVWATGRGEWGEPAAGGGHTCAISWVNELYCWGDGTEGQLGTGDTTSSPVPVQVEPGVTFETLTAGLGHTCAVARGGELLCWGQNSDGRAGPDRVGLLVPTPTPVDGGTTWSAVGAFRRHSCGLRDTTDLHCWGLDRDGALGVGITEDFTGTPMPVTLAWVGPVVGFAAGGFHTCAVTQATAGTAGGPLHCWGLNAKGQLGHPAGALPSDPVGGFEDVLRVAAGLNHTCVVRADGTLWCFGDDASGQVGAGGALDAVFAPQRVGDRADWRRVSGGGAFTCGTRDRGTVWCWGANDRGQLGTSGAGDASATPVRVCFSP